MSSALQVDSLPTEPSGKLIPTCRCYFTAFHRHYKWRFVASLCREDFFPPAFAHFVSHVTSVIPAKFQTFSLLFYLLRWPVINDLCCYYCQKITTCWRLRWWWTYFSNKVFLIWTCSFRYSVIAHSTDESVDIIYMRWETKMFMWLALLWYSIYCSGLRQNLPYL